MTKKYSIIGLILIINICSPSSIQQKFSHFEFLHTFLTQPTYSLKFHGLTNILLSLIINKLHSDDFSNSIVSLNSRYPFSGFQIPQQTQGPGAQVSYSLFFIHVCMYETWNNLFLIEPNQLWVLPLCLQCKQIKWLSATSSVMWMYITRGQNPLTILSSAEMWLPRGLAGRYRKALAITDTLGFFALHLNGQNASFNLQKVHHKANTFPYFCHHALFCSSYKSRHTYLINLNFTFNSSWIVIFTIKNFHLKNQNIHTSKLTAN